MLVARNNAKAGAGSQQIANWAQMLRIDLVQEDLRREAAHLVDRMEMVEHSVGGVQHVRHQRFPDALLEPVEVQPALGLLGLSLELALDHVGQEGVQLRAHQVVAVHVCLAHGADGRPGIQHVPDLEGAVGVELVEPDLVGEAVHRLARMHGAQHEARVLEHVGQQRRLDDRLPADARSAPWGSARPTGASAAPGRRTGPT